MPTRSDVDGDGGSSLKWDPNGSDDTPRGKVAKQRAKELRKAAERRTMERQERRKEKQRQLSGRAEGVQSTARPGLTIAYAADPSNTGCTMSVVGMGDSDETAQGRLAELPSDSLLAVLSHLSAGDLCSCASVCTHMAAAVASPELWSRLHDAIFGHHATEARVRAWEISGVAGGVVDGDAPCLMGEKDGERASPLPAMPSSATPSKHEASLPPMAQDLDALAHRLSCRRRVCKPP